MSKAALFDEKGREIAVAGRAVQIIRPSKELNERNASKMWEDTAEIIREVLQSSGISSDKINAIACTGHGNGLYLVDKEGEPVRNAINSTDTRAHTYIENWVKEGINEKALPLTSQSLWPAQPNALLSWLHDNEPATIEKARWILMAKDYIRLKLTGEVFAEISDMSGTSLMNVTTGEYDDEVLRIFGLEEFRDMLPPLIDSTGLAGKVTKEASEQTGLKEGTPVAGGMFDIDACGLASGIIDTRQMSMVIGTWGNNQYIAREPLIDKNLFMTSIYSIPGWYLMLEGSPTSASNLNWVINNFLESEKKNKGEQFFEWLGGQVANIPPESTDMIFLPFLYGCNEKNNIRAGFYNMRGEHTRSHLIRAVYEGITFSHKNHVNRLLNFREMPEVIRCTGGATQSDVWMQMFADAIGVPMEIPAGSQLGALGAAMAAGVCAGTYKSLEEAVENMTRTERRFEPDNSRESIYKDKYHNYKKLINQFSSA
jgi:L-xylulokinase